MGRQFTAHGHIPWCWEGEVAVSARVSGLQIDRASLTSWTDDLCLAAQLCTSSHTSSTTTGPVITMRTSTLISALLAALPLTEGKLDAIAKKAGLLYFGAATDTPGFRERAGYESKYAQYDEIMWKSGEFGGTTPTNGMKVRHIRSVRRPDNDGAFTDLVPSSVALHRTSAERLQLHRG